METEQRKKKRIRPRKTKTKTETKQRTHSGQTKRRTIAFEILWGELAKWKEFNRGISSRLNLNKEICLIFQMRCFRSRSRQSVWLTFSAWKIKRIYTHAFDLILPLCRYSLFTHTHRYMFFHFRKMCILSVSNGNSCVYFYSWFDYDVTANSSLSHDRLALYIFVCIQ